ncbi:MAG: hypothetical protein IKO61_10195 [Lachnospiraceae bacterium]|nr:hypothetical protein [Lachnospiraceae bacterium]
MKDTDKEDAEYRNVIDELVEAFFPIQRKTAKDNYRYQEACERLISKDKREGILETKVWKRKSSNSALRS